MAKKYSIVKALELAIQSEGLKLIFLLRLCPLIPFNAFNYLCGVTKITVKHFTIGNLGMIPGSLAYVFIGTTISSISDAAQGKGTEG